MDQATPYKESSRSNGPEIAGLPPPPPRKALTAFGITVVPSARRCARMANQCVNLDGFIPNHPNSEEANSARKHIPGPTFSPASRPSATRA